jgi:hypothetical protein
MKPFIAVKYKIIFLLGQHWSINCTMKPFIAVKYKLHNETIHCSEVQTSVFRMPDSWKMWKRSKLPLAAQCS